MAIPHATASTVAARYSAGIRWQEPTKQTDQDHRIAGYPERCNQDDQHPRLHDRKLRPLSSRGTHEKDRADRVVTGNLRDVRPRWHPVNERVFGVVPTSEQRRLRALPGIKLSGGTRRSYQPILAHTAGLHAGSHVSAAVLHALRMLPSSRGPVSAAQEGPSSGLTSLLPAGNERRRSRRERFRPRLQAGGELGHDVRRWL